MKGSWKWLVDENEDLRLRLFLGFAFGGPLLLLLIHFNLGHQGDMKLFYEWFQTIGSSNAFYRIHPDINYPFLGLMAVFAPGWVVEKILQRPLEFLEYRMVLKATLTVIEIGLIFSFAGLMRALHIPKPRLMALLLFLLPSTWAGGSWFGQIDVLGTLFLVLAAAGLVRFAQVEMKGRFGFGFYLVGLLGLQCAILTKQLTWFSIPGLLGALIVGLAVGYNKHGGRTLVFLLLLAGLSFLLLVLPDIFLSVPQGYHTHLGYILLGGGSAHADILSGNGANIWTLISPDPSASALDPLLFGLSAKSWGIVLFATCQVISIGWLVKAGRRRWQDKKPESDRLLDLIATIILYVGVTNLAMAVVLTGVHERYLAHGVPFLILGMSYRTQKFKKIRRTRLLNAGVWFVGFWSGLFVLSSIHWSSFNGVLAPFRSHSIMGCMELVLLLGFLGTARTRN